MQRLLLGICSVISTFLFLAGVHLLVSGQSNPNWSQGFVPTAAQWNAAFTQKQDYLGGGSFQSRVGFFQTGVQFNVTNTDYPIPVVLPNPFLRYRVSDVAISTCSASISTATAGAFTAGGGNVSFQIAAIQALTVTVATPDINNNMMELALTNQNTQAWDLSPIYFRVANPQGSSATCTVSISLQPVS